MNELKRSRTNAWAWSSLAVGCLVAVGSWLGVGCLLPDVSVKIDAAQGKTSPDDGDDDGAAASKDGGARNATGGRDASAGGKRDASSTTSPDAGKTPTSTGGRDGGGSSSLPTIRCPSNLVCTSDVSFVLGALDPNVKADTLVCAQSGVIPMPVSCKSDDECESARLTSAKCTGGYCIQACVE